MEFNTIVKSKLSALFQVYGFDVVEEYKGIIRFESTTMKINVIFNTYEKSYFLEIGKKNDILFPLNDYTLMYFFDCSLSIDNTTLEDFIKNICIVFETKKGITLLEGDSENFIKFKLEEIEIYNATQVHKQVLESASKAWDSNDYIGFIKIIDNINMAEIPESYKLKYRIAKNRL